MEVAGSFSHYDTFFLGIGTSNWVPSRHNKILPGNAGK